MAFRSGIRKAVSCCLLAAIFAAGAARADSAATYGPPAPPPPSRADLTKLGEDFVNRIGKDMSQANLYLSGAGKVELAEHASGTQLPDGEPLLLHGIAGKDNVNLTQDIYSVKQGGRLMISLGDFCTAVGYAIRVSPEKQAASGWFGRQTDTFSLDAKKDEVTVRGRVMAIGPQDIDATPEDILISSDLLEKWFNLDFTYDFAALALLIKSPQPLPAEAAYLRGQKGKNMVYTEAPAKLPYAQQPYGLLSEPYIDTNINSVLTHIPGSAAQQSGSWSTILSGDLLGFNAQGFASGGLQQPYFNSLRVSLGRQDANGQLLGPLHATSYEFGDIDTVSSNLINGGGLEQGVRVSNRPLTGTTSDTSTIIRGNAQPGWDVELYRNDSYVDIRHVGTDGLYDFGDVDLFGGNNDFKLVFYGPHGEIREEHKQIGVNPQALGSGKGYYDVSLSRTDTTTFQNIYGGSNHGTGPHGSGDPHIGAKYEYGLGNFGTATLGFRTNGDNEGDYRSFAQAGLATYMLGTYLNTDFAYEANNDAFSTAITARRNFGKQTMFLQYIGNSSGYNAGNHTNQVINDKFNIQDQAGTGASTRENIHLGLSGPLAGKFSFINHLNYNLNSTYTNFYNGGDQMTASSSLTTGIKAVSLTGQFNYNHSTSSLGIGTTSETLNLSTRSPLYGGSLRLQSEYQLVPTRQTVSDQIEYDRPIMAGLDSTTTFTYLPQPPLTPQKIAAVSLNWQTSKATISPNVSYDNRHNLTAGINVHFGAGADPYSHMYKMYNAYLSTAGGAAARVYLDKNGDGIFDEGDEPMPEVVVRAQQVHRDALSDSRGVAFIPDLPENILTDIIVDQSSFKDSYDISMFKGVSIRPHPGGVTRLDFPVVVAGALDGQANYQTDSKSTKPARNLTVALVAPDGEVRKSVVAAYDGYWSIDLIPPGIYYLMAKTDDSMASGYMTPRLMEFKADGTTKFGQAVTLNAGYNIPFTFRSENAPPDGGNHARVVTPADIESSRVYLEMGRYHSKLALAVAWFKFRMNVPHWQDSYALLTPLAKIRRKEKTGDLPLMIVPRRKVTLDQAATLCRAFIDRKFACGVEVITRYRPLKLQPTIDNGTVDGRALLAAAAGPALPMAGLRVSLFDSDGRAVAAAVTGADGRYAFRKIYSGDYLLLADGQTARKDNLLRPAPAFVDLSYGHMAAAVPDIVLTTASGTAKKDVPVTVHRDLGDYAAVNPTIDTNALKDKVIVLNLGSYHSRPLMAVMWYKLKKKYPAAVRGAHLLVQPADSNMSPKTGENVLRVALPGYDVKDAWDRCNILTAAGEACAVEVMPKGWQELSAATAPPNG